MHVENIGETIFKIRKARGMSRAESAEMVGISESHLDKIETGFRRQGMATYKKIMDTLKVEMKLKDDEFSLKGRCLEKIRETILDSTEEQALFITGLVEYISEHMELLRK